MENTSAVGRIHSTESFGAADGPGVRYIIFMQGCDMRCRYCHNPDTWDKSHGTEITAEQALKQALRYRSYWKKGGGITVSGGEPLLQTDFLTELFRLAKAENVSTCIDTAGQPFTREEPFFSKFSELMNYTDLLLLDIKEISSGRHRTITGHDNANILDMARYLSDIGKPVWIRHVLAPTLSDFDEDIDGLRGFIDTLKNVERVEILPYHTLGRFKWDDMGIKYPLEGVEPPSEERIANAKRRLGIL